MKMNRTLAYGLACLQYLGNGHHTSSEWIEIKEIAQRQNLPAAYCNKVLQALTHAGLVESHRGKGYRLARPLEKISVWDVMEAFTFNGAPKGNSHPLRTGGLLFGCGQGPELSIKLYECLREQVNHWLVGLSLSDIVESVKQEEEKKRTQKPDIRC
ncbi:MAG: Rrf2 family transcriptional regulator [bacterium]